MYEFGVERAGKVVLHNFVIENPTPKPIRITSIGTSCGCLVPERRPDVIPARSACNLPVSLNTDGHSGRLTQQVLLSFDQHKPITLTLTGKIFKDVPDTLKFPTLKQGEDHELEFYVKPYPGEVLSIQRLQYDPEFLNVTCTPVEANFRVLVKLNQKIPYGAFDKTLVIYTNDKVGAAKCTRISGYIQKPVEAQSSRIALGVLSVGQKASQVVTLFSPYGGAIEIDRIEAPHAEGVAWNILPDPKDRRTIELEIALQAVKPGVRYEELYIYAHAGASSERIDVTISALVK